MNDIDDMRNRQGLINDWKSGLEQDLREFLDEQNKVFFDGKGEIVDGSKLQRYCNRTFGRHEPPVSEYGIALALNNRSIGTPRVVLGVRVCMQNLKKQINWSAWENVVT